MITNAIDGIQGSIYELLGRYDLAKTNKLYEW